MQGLCNQYTIVGVTAYGRDFLFDQTSSMKLVASLTELQGSSALKPIMAKMRIEKSKTCASRTMCASSGRMILVIASSTAVARTWHNQHDQPVDQAADSPAQEACGTDLGEAEHPEQLTVARQRFGQQARTPFRKFDRGG